MKQRRVGVQLAQAHDARSQGGGGGTNAMLITDLPP